MASKFQTIARLRPMTAADLAVVHGLSREQNWPHRQEDWTQFLELGTGIVAEHDGRVVGSAMSWTYGADYATIGMVIVSPAAQGMGIGRQMMTHLIGMLDGRSILLNATDEGLRLYTQQGFAPLGRVFQHQGAAFAVPIAQLIPEERVAPMKAGDMQAVISLDRTATGLDRGYAIESLCAASQGIMLRREGEAAGFALFRRFGRGYAVGPVCAPDIGGAKALISHWLGSHEGMFCRLDVREDSGLCAWLDELGLPCVGRVTPMVRGVAPAVSEASKAFALINQALG